MGFFKPNVEKLVARGDVKGLVRALNNRAVYAATAEALLKMGEPAVSTLIEAITSDDYLSEVATQAVSGFGEVAVSALITALKDDPITGWSPGSSYIREALVEIGEVAVPALIEVMKDKGMHYLANLSFGRVLIGPGEAARLALSEIGKAAVPALIEVMKDKDEWVRSVATQALSEIGEAAVPALNEALKDENSDVREAIEEALEKIKAKDEERS